MEHVRKFLSGDEVSGAKVLSSFAFGGLVALALVVGVVEETTADYCYGIPQWETGWGWCTSDPCYPPQPSPTVKYKYFHGSSCVQVNPPETTCACY